jgi:glucosamine-6-phosphate deaminase
VVTLAESCRQQQVGEGQFARLEDVPRQAISLTVQLLLTPRHMLVIAPEARKAAGVRAALEGPITPDCPASILRTAPHAHLYLDWNSAALPPDLAFYIAVRHGVGFARLLSQNGPLDRLSF